MGTIGLGYGSEYQLLRMLGHHRHDFISQLKEGLGIECEIDWLDYPYDSSSVSLDGELQAVECFSALDIYPRILAAWKEFWPQGGTQQSWDGIFVAGGKWYFVEAKAHIGEAFSSRRTRTEHSIQKITDAFDWTISQLGLEGTCGKAWFYSPFYQLANRLAFVVFIRETFNIDAELLYLHFVNGYERPGLSINRRLTRSVIRESKSVKDPAEWDSLWKEELGSLGITQAPTYVHQLTVECQK